MSVNSKDKGKDRHPPLCSGSRSLAADAVWRLMPRGAGGSRGQALEAL